MAETRWSDTVDGKPWYGRNYVIGESGIGKSVGAFYFLFRLLAAGQPVFFYPNTKRAGVDFVQEEGKTMHRRENIDAARKSWAIINDPTWLPGSWWIEATVGGIWTAPPPEPKHLEWFTKQLKASTWEMKLGEETAVLKILKQSSIFKPSEGWGQFPLDLRPPIAEEVAQHGNFKHKKYQSKERHTSRPQFLRATKASFPEYRQPAALSTAAIASRPLEAQSISHQKPLPPTNFPEVDTGFGKVVDSSIGVGEEVKEEVEGADTLAYYPIDFDMRAITRAEVGYSAPKEAPFAYLRDPVVSTQWRINYSQSGSSSCHDTTTVLHAPMRRRRFTPRGAMPMLVAHHEPTPLSSQASSSPLKDLRGPST
ncbi:hypothetical protein FB45DRAFT_881717 [Roridomyces roridus]|uniref:Uncharacterized protein n=1 Tax=Roridomyces roridus TaxID=1738132 RepID=A0AAD7AYC8_9AGAR|nr:hypothetical protein FB45DRAFT_881717 [Roridomyces roridus]